MRCSKLPVFAHPSIATRAVGVDYDVLDDVAVVGWWICPVRVLVAAHYTSEPIVKCQSEGLGSLIFCGTLFFFYIYIHRFTCKRNTHT